MKSSKTAIFEKKTGCPQIFIYKSTTNILDNLFITSQQI